MRVVVFGAGRFYEKRREQLLSFPDIEIVAVIDNNPDIVGTYVDAVPVLKVNQIIMIDFDIILLMSVKTSEMKKQLLSLGIDDKKIWYWKQLKCEQNKGHFCFYCGRSNKVHAKQRVLIISTDLGYNGGSLAAFYAAKALENRRYDVVLAAPGGNPDFIQEINNSKINVMICSALPYLYSKEIDFVNQFDFVIVNVFQMVLCASVIRKIKPVLWWIHEASIFYDPVLELFDNYAKEEMLEGIYICAVSRIAQTSFNRYFPGRITKTLAYGIPDERNVIARSNKNSKVIFAVIGGVIPLKAQDVFLQAVNRLPEELKKNGLFWIIGLMGQDTYSKQIMDMVSQEPSARLFGEMTREEIKKIYETIDVLVCPSMEETMSIVVTEAMMYEKVCIMSNMVGMADYIIDGQNGFVFRMGDADSLAEKMSWVFHHKEETKLIGKNARKIYEDNFTMERFGERLEEALCAAQKC